MVGRKMSVLYDVRKFLQDLYFSICVTVYYSNEMLANLRDQRLATSIPVNEESLLEMRLNDIINVLEQSYTMGQNILPNLFLNFFHNVQELANLYISTFYNKNVELKKKMKYDDAGSAFIIYCNYKILQK